MGFDVKQFISHIESLVNKDSIMISEFSGNNRLDPHEYRNTIFTDELKKVKAENPDENFEEILRNAGVEENFIKEIMGAEYSNAPKQQKNEPTLSRAIQNSAKNDVIHNYLSANSQKFINTGNWDDITENLAATVMTNVIPSERPYYSKLVAQVQTVVNAMKQQTYNSRENVLDLYKKVVDSLPKVENDEFKQFKLDLVETMVEFAEANQKQKEEAQVASRFSELTTQLPKDKAILAVITRNSELDEKYTKLRETMSEDEAFVKIMEDPKFKAEYEVMTGTMSRIDAVKQLKKEFKGSYFDINQFEENTILDQARDDVWAAVQRQKVGLGFENEALKSSRAIENAVVDDLKSKGLYDKYTKKVLRGELSLAQKLSFERSDIKAYRKSVAAYNRAEEAKQKPFTEDELMSVLKDGSGKKADAPFQRLKAGGFPKRDENGAVINDENGNPIIEPGNHWIEVNSDGTYNISNLSNMIKDRIGKDLKANRQLSDYNVYSEIVNVANELGVTPKQAKRLIKMCGYDVEGKNWAKIFMNAFVDTAIGALPGIAATGIGLMGLTKDITSPYAVAQLSIKNEIVGELNISALGLNSITGDEDSILDQLKYTPIDDQGHVLGDVMSYEFVSQANNAYSMGELKFRIDTSKIAYSNMKIAMPDGQVVSIQDLIDSGKIDANEDGSITMQVEADPKDLGVKDAITAMVKAFALSYGLNVLKEALKEQGGDFPVITTQFNETDVDQYLAKLNKNSKLTPDMKKGFAIIARNFVSEGKWNSEGYKKFLNTIAGDESFLNKQEALIGLYEDAHQQKPNTQGGTPVTLQPVDPKPIKPTNPNVGDIEPITITSADPQLEVHEEQTGDYIQVPQAKFNHWDDVVNGYPCLKRKEFTKQYKIGVDKNSGKAIKATLNNRMVKVMQAIIPQKGDDTKVVYNINTIAAFAEEAILHGIDKAIEKYPELHVNKSIYNAVVQAKGGVRGNIMVPAIYDPAVEDENNDGICGWQENGKTKIKPGSGSTVSVEIREVYVNGKPKYYYRNVGDTSQGTEITEQEYNDLKKRPGVGTY